MKRHVRFCAEGILVLIALVAALLSQRAFVEDWFRGQSKPELPKAVTFEDIKTVEPEGAIVVVPDVVETQPVVEEQVPLPVPPEAGVKSPEPEQTPPPVILPDSINLAVPFTPQAPHANWSEPFEETCEEASLYMVDAFYKGIPEGLISADTAEKDLLSIVGFENETFGFYQDTTAQQVSTVAELLYGYGHVDLIDNPTVEDIKTQLVAGRPVLVPTAGRLLGNPNFQQPGPIYHMLVVRGYTAKGQFIVNDPGTRRGEAYVYDFDTLMNAMHDWNNGDAIEQGEKRAIVIYPN